MKIGTDAILLGSWVDISNCDSILDIGTGCGIIALMLAQRSKAKIEAIDIDRDSIEEASANFKNSPWPSRLNACQSSLQNYNKKSLSTYDLIVSNPPFFQNSLLPRKKNYQLAKHNIGLSFSEILNLSVKMLNPNGRFAIILPDASKNQFISLAETMKLYLHDQLITRPASTKSTKRLILVFKLFKTDSINSSSLTLRNEDGSYTDEYKELTGIFHPKF